MEMREKSLEQQDQTLNAEQAEVKIVSEETVEMADSQVEQSQEVALAAMTKEELLKALEALAEKDAAEVGREEVGRLKQQFYAIRKTEVEKEKAEFIEQGNDVAAFVAQNDDAEEKFKETLNVIKEKKAALLAAQEAERQANFEKKAKIIEEINTLAGAWAAVGT